MIKVFRPATIPVVLTGRGVTETQENNLKYLALKNSYNSGKIKFDIKSSIYNASTVKSSLKKAQFKKCCFCEKLQNDEYGAVEHYRPKGGYKSLRSDKLKKPGYYWTGYDWKNLLFVCEPCNKKKGNIFPLENEKFRAKNHEGNILLEKPLLLDPAGSKNPRNHIKFDFQFVRGISNEGIQTVAVCNLDRDSLNEERLKVLVEIQERIAIIITNIDKSAVRRAKRYLKKSVSPNAPFSAMAQDYIATSPIILT